MPQSGPFNAAAVLSDPALHAFIGGAPSSARALRERYERLVAGSPDPAVSWHNWVVREGAHLTGTVQATVTDDTHAEIAWVIGTPWQGRRLACENNTAAGLLEAPQQFQRAAAHRHHPGDQDGAI